MKTLYLLLICSLLFSTSCNTNSNDPVSDDTITYYPFQKEPGGRWGMVSPKGDVLFEEEFVNEPTVAMKGRFMVRNNDGLWEIYTTDKKPRQIGKAYLMAAQFKADVTPVVEPGGPIVFIDREGNVKFNFGKLDGVTVIAVNNFSEGLAIFKLSNGLYGAIDTGGKVVIPARYSSLKDCGDGKLIGMESKYKKQFMADSLRVRIDVIDKKGEKCFDFPHSEYIGMASRFKDGSLAVGTQSEDGEMRWGVIDAKNEWILPPSEKMREITDIVKDKVLFSDGSMYGLMNLKGELLIRAKYAALSFADNDRLLWASNDGSNYFLIDTEDRKVGSEEYEEANPFHGNATCPVKAWENNWIFIDRNGKPINPKGYAYIGVTTGDDTVLNDYFDINGIIGQLRLTSTGLDGLSFKSLAPDIVRTVAPEEAKTPYIFDLSKLLVYEKDVDGIPLWFNVAFYDYIATEQDGNLAFNRNAHPIGFKVYFYINHNDRMQGKGETVYKALSQAIAKLGKTQTWNEDNSMVYELSDDSYIAISRDDEECRLYIAKKGVIMREGDWHPDEYDPQAQ